jgi:zinc protease
LKFQTRETLRYVSMMSLPMNRKECALVERQEGNVRLCLKIRWGCSILIVLVMVCGSKIYGQNVPIVYYKLPNGLKVVLSQDNSAPIVAVGVYYQIGFRIEPRNRTGFAHLFEHMMFQGSQNLGKMEFIQLIQKNGGILNGSTRFDFTNYYEALPSNTLQTVLWAEADRMRGLQITDANLSNQKSVVTNEVKVNVINSPYGGFPWLDMPQYANTNWYNSHNFYGDLNDIDAATLDDVQRFFKTYYAPNNAALAVVGDFDIELAKAWVQQYFGDIP